MKNVLETSELLKIDGNMGLGHNRYPTSGNGVINEIQPYFLNSPYGLGLVHNGNIINMKELSKNLENNSIFLNSNSLLDNIEMDDGTLKRL